MNLMVSALRTTFELFALPFIVLGALFARLIPRKFDVGIGPQPIISHVHHRKALEQKGYLVETFVNTIYFITEDFDVRADLWIPASWARTILLPVIGFIWTVFRYQVVYLYFHGGFLGLGTTWLWRIEPLLYRLAGTKVVVMPYGSDIQDMSRSPNLIFKHAISQDYPSVRFNRTMVSEKIDLWTCRASHVISGCDWVYYMFHWDTLMLGHFSIDTDLWRPSLQRNSNPRDDNIKILHAPNHRNIKGTRYFIEAVNELKAEGFPVELILAEGVSNHKIRELLDSADIVADQLIVGWYAMFALEGLSMGKPVLCYLDPGLEDLYVHAGLIQRGELPIVNCNIWTVKTAIRELLEDPDKFIDLGERSRNFAIKHHSLQAVGEVFDRINRSIGVMPSVQPRTDYEK